MHLRVEIPPYAAFEKGAAMGYVVGASVLGEEEGGDGGGEGVVEGCGLVFEVVEEGEGGEEEGEAPEGGGVED